MEINCWVRTAGGGRKGEKRVVRAPDPPASGVKGLRDAIRAVRAEDGPPGGPDDVIFALPSGVGSGLRAAARVALGAGSVVVVFLLLALAVVGADSRSGVLAALVTVLFVAGGFVALVWRLDVGIEIRADGTLVRRGWNGIDTLDLRSFSRVTVKEGKSGDGMDYPLGG